jgi:hypothetical protein
MTHDTRSPATTFRPIPTRTTPSGALAFAVAGLMFLLYPAVRPAGDDAEAWASSAWVASHLFAMIGFILVPLGLFALLDILGSTRLMRSTLVTMWVGAGLTLPYYGAEDFGLHVIGQRSLAEGDPGLLELGDAFRLHPTSATTFVLGLLLLAVGGVLTAVAIWRSGRLSRWSGVPLAAGFVLFFPQFYTPMEVRTAHGVLMAVGCVWVGVSAWRARA